MKERVPVEKLQKMLVALESRRKTTKQREGQTKVEGRESAALDFLIKSGQWSGWVSDVCRFVFCWMDNFGIIKFY